MQQFVVFLNTEKQLFEGVDANEASLKSIGGDYAPITKFLKAQKGQPFDRITLKDTGDFYDSFSVEALQDAIIIEADSIKEGYDLRDRWGQDILGLSEPSIGILIENDIFISDLVKILLDKILNNG